MRHPIQHVINHSWQRPAWNWLARAMPEWKWSHHTRQALTHPASEFLHSLLTGLSAAWAARDARSLLVSHGPLPAVYAGMMLRWVAPERPHMVYAFNFTELPKGRFKRHLIGTTLRRATRLVVFSSMERVLYARYFGIPVEKIDFLHWAAQPLVAGTPPVDLPSNDFVCAIGSQGRDYKTLVEAARLLPQISFVLVVNPENLSGLEIPPNVQTYFKLPLDQVGAVLERCSFMVLPLATTEVPCGHVTLVSAFHARKAVISSGSSGVADYVRHGDNGLLAPPRSPAALAEAIQCLWNDASKCQSMGERGFEFAQAHCMEGAVVRYFKTFLTRMEQQ